MNKENEHQPELKSQVRGLFKKGDKVASVANPLPKQYQRIHKAKHLEQPLRIIKLDSLSELNLNHEDNSRDQGSFRGDHFLDNLGR